ncbi:MAG: RluA family pseudouridine synthase [Treponema sp.]|nr:RluA family pseudouridine synthase [Treponema sp.]
MTPLMPGNQSRKTGKQNSKINARMEPVNPRLSCVVENSFLPGLRLDRYVAENLKILSRSQIKSRKLRAAVNGKEVKVSRLLRGGETLDLFWEDAPVYDLVPQDIPLEIVYEDENVAVINKPQGMVVHPGAGNYNGTLANALYFRRLCRNAGSGLPPAPGDYLSQGDLSPGIRPGIVHRLDKDTSGLIITAWDEGTHFFLAEQFKQRKVIKTYAAIVSGCPPDSCGQIEKPIGRDRNNRKLFAVNTNGKKSLTLYKVAKTWGNYSLLLIRPKTGRTHQIRVHLKYLGFPIVGDPLYGAKDGILQGCTLMLHAKRLTIKLPGTGRQTFRTKFPARFNDVFSVLDK